MTLNTEVFERIQNFNKGREPELLKLKYQGSTVKDLMKHWTATQAEPNFFKLLDVAGRIAGTGRLGVPRYVLLVEGKGFPNQNYLLDLKQECPSSTKWWTAGICDR